MDLGIQWKILQSDWRNLHSSLKKKNENANFKKKDRNTTTPVYSLMHYHAWKLILIEVTSSRIRTCNLWHHNLVHYQLCKLESDGYLPKIGLFIP